MSDTAKVKNVSGEDLLVPWLGGRLVVAGQAVEVPVEDVWAYTQQTETWAPHDNPAKKAHKDAQDALADAQAAEAAEREARFGPEPSGEETAETPTESAPAEPGKED